ncbi:MAG: hypothetical protein QMD46_08490 [Methanomicrobiales archaeon]|nr:hypothetical protein [Methanomicrobiales archaeon]MDI6876284.1 hypothetical protein [Methanomicrobiales archaeon]
MSVTEDARRIRGLPGGPKLRLPCLLWERHDPLPAVRLRNPSHLPPNLRVHPAPGGRQIPGLPARMERQPPKLTKNATR